MSIESMTIALHHSQATGAAKLVLIGIANHDGDGGSWPSLATLAKYAGITPRNVRKHISTLIELGEIMRHVQQGGTHHMADHDRPNLYQFRLHCPAGCDRTKNHRIVDKSPTPPVTSDPPVGSDPRPRSAATPAPRSAATPEPSFEPPFNSDSSFLSTSPDAFESCWACGQVHVLDNRGFCPKCVYSGKDTPMIACTGCGSARRRQRPGEQQFTCGSCKQDAPFQAAFDDGVPTSDIPGPPHHGKARPWEK